MLILAAIAALIGAFYLFEERKKRIAKEEGMLKAKKAAEKAEKKRLSR